MKDDDLISRMVQEAKRVKRNEDTIAKLLANFGTTRQEAESILEGLYHELNAAKFNHELPDDPLIKISNEMGGNPASFKILSDAKGNVSIYVSPGCEPQDYRRTMLHEMCHYFASGHGDEFQKKLAEVAEGEPWLEEELERCGRYAIYDRIKRGWIRTVQDLAEQSPDLRWKQARSLAAMQLDCKTSDIRDALGTQFKTEWDWWTKERSKSK
jgi:hypothetical protein